MSAGLARTARSEKPPTSGPGLLLSLAAAAVFPFDRVLAGMVAAGQGLEALCLYLGLSRALLHDDLIRLGLRTPHDKPLRKPGPRGWAALDTMRLIAWRVAGIHPETIGPRLGNRSANAVRAKCRRLGVPTPDRKLLRRVDPANLADAVPGFGFSPTSPAATHPAARSSSDRCGTAAGPVIRQSDDAASRGVVVLRPAFPGNEAASLAPTRRAKGTRGPAGQRELQLFRIIARGEPALPISSPPASDPTGTLFPPLSVPSPGLDRSQGTGTNADLAWIASASDRTRNREIVETLSRRYFGGQGYKQTAREIGITPSTLASFYDRIDIPRDRDRRKFGDRYDEDRARAVLERSGYYLETCRKTGRLFWLHRRDKGKILFNRETRRAMGKISEYEKYKSEEICI